MFDFIFVHGYLAVQTAFYKLTIFSFNNNNNNIEIQTVDLSDTFHNTHQNVYHEFESVLIFKIRTCLLLINIHIK